MSVAEAHAQVFARAARRVLVAGLLLGGGAVAAGAAAGGTALVGAAWGGGAGVVMAAVSAGALAYPWHRSPLLAGGGVALSFLLKIVVMLVVVAVLSGRRDSFAPGWFFGALAVCVIGVVAVEVTTLATGRVLTVEPSGPQEDAGGAPEKGPGQVPEG